QYPRRYVNIRVPGGASMASRRTRIKGIANIPQRRKPTTAGPEEQIKAAPEIAEDATLNLNSEIAHGNGESVKEPPQPPPAEEPSESSANITEINDDKISPPSIEEVAVKEESVEVSDNKSEQKPTVPARRKFIKPAVSLNAINRKLKDAEDGKAAQVNQKPPKSNKIVVLNEIIAYPDQTQRDAKRLVANNPQIQSPESEYPIPPPSPSKVNRSRIKAVPRLGQRNTSFSASESEDESRRNHRHRNDSVCSTASGYQDSSSIAECPSPQKPKEFNSVIQRKCRRTEQSRKLAEARRDFIIKFGNKKPDRQKLTMIDLIFYNPTTNPMTHDNKKKEGVEVENGGKEEQEKNEESVDDPGKSGSDEENEMPAPQIKIGPQGEIVVDEQSLVIESKAVKKNREELEKSKVVNGDFDTGYGVYKRAKRSKDWSKHETLKFYKALNTIGTDFTLMCELFPRRSRRELKMKFKKEERINKTLIDRAIMQPCGFDFNDFKHEVDMEEKELLELERQKEREKELKKEAKKRKASLALKGAAEKISKVAEKPKEKKKKKALDINNVLDDDDDDESDADESEIESVFDEEDDNTQDKLMQTIQKPTRSGRVPKILDRYKAPEPEAKSLKAEPGSLIVVASTGSNGQPVYRVCMVTPEQNRQQIGDDMESLSKALECKQNSCIESLFTLSTSSIPKQCEPMEIEENNITIPAEDENVKDIPENEAANNQ
ncbi:transcription factor TFIIIB component B'' -like protein, partial [Asbolus verrucosus]